MDAGALKQRGEQRQRCPPDRSDDPGVRVDVGEIGDGDGRWRYQPQMPGSCCVMADDVFLRWSAVGGSQGLTTFSDVASFLIEQYEATQAGQVGGGRCKHCDTPLTLFCLTCQRPALQTPISEGPAVDAVSTLMPDKVAVKPEMVATQPMETLPCQTGRDGTRDAVTPSTQRQHGWHTDRRTWASPTPSTPLAPPAPSTPAALPPPLTPSAPLTPSTPPVPLTPLTPPVPQTPSAPPPPPAPAAQPIRCSCPFHAASDAKTKPTSPAVADANVVCTLKATFSSSSGKCESSMGAQRTSACSPTAVGAVLRDVVKECQRTESVRSAGVGEGGVSAEAASGKHLRKKRKDAGMKRGRYQRRDPSFDARYAGEVAPGDKNTGVKRRRYRRDLAFDARCASEVAPGDKATGVKQRRYRRGDLAFDTRCAGEGGPGDKNAEDLAVTLTGSKPSPKKQKQSDDELDEASSALEAGVSESKAVGFVMLCRPGEHAHQKPDGIREANTEEPRAPGQLLVKDRGDKETALGVKWKRRGRNRTSCQEAKEARNDHQNANRSRMNHQEPQEIQSLVCDSMNRESQTGGCDPVYRESLSGVCDPVNRESRCGVCDPVNRESQTGVCELIKTESQTLVSDPGEKERQTLVFDPGEKERQTLVSDPDKKERHTLVSDPVEKERQTLVSDPVEKERQTLVSDLVEKERQTLVSDPVEKERQTSVSDPMNQESQRVTCDTCGEEMANKRALQSHRTQHHTQKRHKCETCGEAFPKRWRLKLHGYKHSGERPFKCDTCTATFTRNYCLQQHRLNIHCNARAYVCDKCGRSFNQLGCLRTHLRLHSGERPYRCQHCHLTFAQGSGLSSHMKWHTGAKPYLCKECGAVFSHASNLRVHLRVHSGERPYLCQECGFGAVTSSQLRRHMQKHTGQKPNPVTCGVCHRALSSSGKLSRHMKNVHGLVTSSRPKRRLTLPVAVVPESEELRDSAGLEASDS